MTDKELINEALKAREMAYCPYSNFAVGAALLTKEGKVYRGCNIENASYNPTNCAERTAFFKAISEGERNFEKIAIVGGNMDKEITGFAYPCGPCRQVMREFCSPKTFEVIVAKNENEYQKNTLEQMLPFGFGPEDLT